MSPTAKALCDDLLRRHAQRPVVVGLDGSSSLTLADGYLPLLVNYTHEDKEAKGLRKLADPAADRPPIHFSALEAAQQHDAVMIMGDEGAGKTSFALDLALSLAGEQVRDARFNLARLRRTLPRNDLGHSAMESWAGPAAIPVYLSLQAPVDLADLILRKTSGVADLLAEAGRAGVIVILDGADRLGDSGSDALMDLSRLLADYRDVRLLVLGRTEVCARWSLPEGFASFSLLPLLAAQRAQYQATSRPFWPTRPDLFMLSMDMGEAPEPGWRLVDRWLERALPETGHIDRWAAEAFERVVGTSAAKPGAVVSASLSDRAPALVDTLAPFLIARHLQTVPLPALAALFESAPEVWGDAMRLLAQRMAGGGLSAAALVDRLLTVRGEASAWGPIVAADILSCPDSGSSQTAQWDIVKPALADLIARGLLTAPARNKAGRHLGRQGDPRDLEALVTIAPGAFTMGSSGQVNSTPAHTVFVQGFRIGRFPVTNRSYGRFVQETGRLWRSPDGHAPERSNAPATDLTWRDARAYCEWVTRIWRADGRIGPSEAARLPTEPEWEYAARGAQPDSPDERDGIVYPWRGPWRPDHANSSEAGFNASCAVGLFPKGRSPAGVEDMSGQVWEWTSTLWGDDMATPSFAYPYVDDGREAADAGPSVRRVLRGGCFSSAKQKACCTYRGSLEPDGFWRGNGFRVVVSGG
jgi:iron(II)-dependent oxidoreductase